MDPTHPSYNSYSSYLWQLKGNKNTKRIKSNSGRKRITIVGAVNLVNKELTSIITESNCDRELIRSFLNEVKKEYPKAKQIKIILDNATYQKSNDIQEYAKSLGIELIYLPPYTPNLALIERVWKFFKKKFLHNTYYDTFEKFNEAIDLFFKNWSNYMDELETLLTLEFEIIEGE